MQTILYLTCIKAAKCIICMLYLQVVYSHFTMIGSREQATWPGNERFWPIANSATLRPVDDCLKLKAVTPKAIQPGSNTFQYESGNGASHTGMCSAFLEDNGKETALNTEINCISLHQAMAVDIPNVKCDSCTLKIKMAANHLVTTIEYYDSCLDISISGSGTATGATAATASAVPTDPVPANTAGIPQETPASLVPAVAMTTNAVPAKTAPRRHRKGRK